SPHRQRLPAVPADLLDHLPGPLGRREIVDGHLGTLPGEPPGDGPSNPPAGAGDQRDLAVQTAHPKTLLTCSAREPLAPSLCAGLRGPDRRSRRAAAVQEREEKGDKARIWVRNPRDDSHRQQEDQYLMHSSRSTFKARPAAAWIFALAVSAGSFWLQAPQAGALPLEPAVHPPVGEEAPHHRPQGSDASHAHAELTLERIHDELSQHIARVRDLTARVSFVQVSPRDGSKIEGELELAAIVPDLARATWVKPEIYA